MVVETVTVTVVGILGSSLAARQQQNQRNKFSSAQKCDLLSLSLSLARSLYTSTLWFSLELRTVAIGDHPREVQRKRSDLSRAAFCPPEIRIVIEITMDGFQTILYFPYSLSLRLNFPTLARLLFMSAPRKEKMLGPWKFPRNLSHLHLLYSLEKQRTTVDFRLQLATQ